MEASKEKKSEKEDGKRLYGGIPLGSVFLTECCATYLRSVLCRLLAENASFAETKSQAIYFFLEKNAKKSY